MQSHKVRATEAGTANLLMMDQAQAYGYFYQPDAVFDLQLLQQAVTMIFNGPEADE